ncbi:hypothetical protein CLV76_12920 [Marivita geojedonensis]|nr:hypothetical protein CLV76_12920 [Marivita geojedonensis]
MSHNSMRPIQDSQLKMELLKIGSPAAVRDAPTLRPLRTPRSFRCKTCKFLANRMLRIGHWFEQRAEAYG